MYKIKLGKLKKKLTKFGEAHYYYFSLVLISIAIPLSFSGLSCETAEAVVRRCSVKKLF